MSRRELEHVMDECCRGLRLVGEALARAKPRGTSCDKSYNFSEDCTSRAAQLEDAGKEKM